MLFKRNGANPLPADSLETMRVRKIGLARVEVALSGEGGGYADHMQ